MDINPSGSGRDCGHNLVTRKTLTSYHSVRFLDIQHQAQDSIQSMHLFRAYWMNKNH